MKEMIEKLLIINLENEYLQDKDTGGNQFQLFVVKMVKIMFYLMKNYLLNFRYLMFIKDIMEKLHLKILKIQKSGNIMIRMESKVTEKIYNAWLCRIIM